MLPLSVPLPDQPRDLRRVAVTHPPTRWPARAPTDTPGPRPPQAADPINDHEKVRKSRQDTSTPLSRASARWTPGPTPSLPPTPRARGLRRRVVNVHALVATGSTATGHREILGPSRLTPAGACRGNWGDLARRQLAALSQPLRGQARGRHPKSSWPWVRVLLHSVYDQPDATSVHAQFNWVLDTLAEKLPTSPSTSMAPGQTCLRPPRSPRRFGANLVEHPKNG